jgi:peptidoglycan-associated lipoprotein
MPVVAISPNINVSDEIAKACKLGFDVIESAPKFDFDQSALGAQDSNALAQIAQCLTAGPLAGRSIELVGRADQRGEIEYNMALGERRASSVGQYLSVRGVESARMIQSSRGKLDATGTDEAGWKRDRRVDVLLRQ